jgi:hypothetical protein
MAIHCDPADAPVGDISTAMLHVDSMLKKIRGEPASAEAGQLDEMWLASGVHFRTLIQGFGSLVYAYMIWLRKAHEAADKDVLEAIVPYTVSMLGQMTRVSKETIPAMTGMIIAAAIGLSPTLWREHYGPWSREELNSLEITTVILAERVNFYSGDNDAAVRLITEALDAEAGSNGDGSAG